MSTKVQVLAYGHTMYRCTVNVSKQEADKEIREFISSGGDSVLKLTREYDGATVAIPREVAKQSVFVVYDED